MSNKRNRAVLDEDEYIIDEYEYPSDNNGSDEDPTQVDNSFYLRGENFFFPWTPRKQWLYLHQ
jgi:hypothetical protein